MSSLDDKLKLPSGLVLEDRMAMAPLTNRQSHDDGTLSDAEFLWLERRARDGFRFISTCAAYVSDEGKVWQGQLGLSDDIHLPGLQRLTSAVHGHGARIVAQLHHGGAQGTFTQEPLSPDNATEDDLARVIADFVDAATRCERAGFDGVEVHGANGYLFTQFLSPMNNTRTDAYGGSIEKRARFLLDAVRAVCAAVDIAVGVRLSPVDVFGVRGIVLDDSVQVARWLGALDIDWLHLSLRDACDASVRAIREVVPKQVALFTVGGIWTRADAQRALDEGADVVVLGRAAMAHPGWPRVSKAVDFAPSKPPWRRQDLLSADLSEAFLRYITPFPGMLEGGAPPR